MFFSAARTQLIHFPLRHYKPTPAVYKFSFFNDVLTFSDSVTCLGCILTSTLSDANDIMRATSDLCRKANCMLSTFVPCDSAVKNQSLLLILSLSV